MGRRGGLKEREGREKVRKKKEPQSGKLNRIRNVQFERLCIATNMLLYGLGGALLGARVVGVVSETDV